MCAGTASDPSVLYRQVILKHARAPVGLDRALHATHRAEASNPLCGDEVRVEFRVAGERIEEAAYGGEFCAVCSASASLLCAHAEGRSLDAFGLLAAALLAALDGRGDPDVLPTDLRALMAVRRFPVRAKCAALPWQAARSALDLQ